MARRVRGNVAVFTGQFRNVKGLEGLQRRIAAIEPGAVAKVKPAIAKAGDLLVAKIKPIVPVSALEAAAGELRDSVRAEPGDHELAVKVVEDGRDDAGRPIAKHVEHGHRAVDGSHVPALPHFWPAYRTLRKKIQSLVGRAMTAGAKAGFAKSQGGDPT